MKHKTGECAGGKHEPTAIGLDAALEEEEETDARNEKAGRWHWKHTETKGSAQRPSSTDAE